MPPIRLSGKDLTGGSFLDDEHTGRGAPVRLSGDDLAGGSFLDDPVPAAPPPEVGKVESFLRGASQGATLGFRDELVGAVESLFTGKSYEQARDESRANDKAAQEANPWTYTAGDLAGTGATMFIPGLGVAKGASLAANAAKAAIAGGIGGLGASEKGDIGGQLSDAASSALISGATAGVMGKVIGGAPERSVKRVLGDLTDGATATQRDRLVGAAGKKVDDVLEIVRGDKAFKAAGRDPNALLEAVENGLERAGTQLDDIYAKAGKATPGIKLEDVTKTLSKLASGLEKDPGKLSAARAVRSQIDDVMQSWGERTHVSPQEVRVLAKDIADAAFRGSPAVAPKQGQVVSQQIWGTLKDLIGENIDEAGQKLGAGGRKELEALNKRMSTLMNMREAVRYRATREATESTRLKDRISAGLDVGAALADPSLFVAKKAFDWVGKPAARAVDEQLATLVTAARNGSTAAQLTQRALEFGLAPAAAKSIASWATDRFGAPGVSGE